MTAYQDNRLPVATPSAWADALRVARLVAADPHGIGGVVLRAGAGPVRDRWLAALRAHLPSGSPMRRMPGGIADDRLIGGLDLPATLAAGRPVAQTGLLAESDGGCVVVPMAERLEPGIAARLAATLDTGWVRVERDGLGQSLPARFGLILLDEGIGADERVPTVLSERLAFHLDLSAIAWGDVQDAPTPEEQPNGAATQTDAAITALVQAAEALGIGSLRGPLLALRVAHLAASLDGRDALSDADTIEAARLVLGPRATQMPATEPAPEEGDAPSDQPPQGEGDPAPETPSEANALDDSVVAAARAAIPPHLLALLTGDGPRPTAPKAGKAGAAAAAKRSGRPAGTRPGDPRQGRLNLIETLRAAAPWQRIRQRQASSPEMPIAGGSRRIIVRAEDFRITRFSQRTETTTIFAVDASGSAALERLAEAKGAVELLLAQAYIRRDKVALVAFRGRSAELILAPTRSLVRARRGLAGLPGGGGTPLASGIDAVAALALGVRRSGGTPVVVVLTDGRANIARSGEPGRARAGADALQSAGAFRATNVRAILIDTAPRPQDPARRLADAMGARYLPLPYADAGAMSAAIRSAT
ncbi:magnesium chelatase subunit D [Methylobacterium sp. BTF04]|uniref:magnesium chelatase subunit D n=1 Tax=Methylobacterium sp. BTF04 TaxID=2708300 RepID=UPI0013D8D66B|nr:magnesium chelatase subunit D [Methylobacterium sp. BTF04]